MTKVQKVTLETKLLNLLTTIYDNEDRLTPMENDTYITAKTQYESITETLQTLGYTIKVTENKFGYIVNIDIMKG